MRRALVISVIALVLLPAAPAAAGSPEVGIADDRVMLRGGATADRAVQEWSAMGVETVRMFAYWARIGPAGRKRPAGFDAADPHSPLYAWGSLDAAVDRVRAAGMRVMLTITGPGPLWTSGSPGRGNPAYRPRAAAYADFATAVARRYGARVDRYILWNEPNLTTWLAPRGTAPHLYRGLVRAAYPAVRGADPGAQVIIGALAPRGTSIATHPLAFARALGCRSASFRRVRSGACRSFRPATGDGFAIHPYGLLSPPDRPLRHRDDVNLGELGDLADTLDRLQRRGALRASTRRFGIYVDEYGYQTNPPDRIGGVSARTQDTWLQRAAYLAWRNPRVKLLTQYLWRDEPRSGDGSYGGWQSGLRYVDGRPKRSLAHFDTPFVLDAERGRLWGQMRPGGAHRVTIERRLRGRSTWRPLATATTDARGYFSVRRRLTRGAAYRFRADGATSAARRH